METSTNNPNGRPPFARNKRTFDDLEILEAIASETLSDGMLVLTESRTAYALQVDQSTVRSLIDAGELPTIEIGDHRKKRFIRIPAASVLEFVRRRTPAICEPQHFKMDS